MECSEEIMEHIHCHAAKSLGLGYHPVLLYFGDSRGILDCIDDLSQTGSILDDLESLHPVLGIKSPLEISYVISRRRITTLVCSIEVKAKVADLPD